VALSARLLSLGKPTAGTPRRGLWLDAGAISNNLIDWSGIVGLSTEIRAGRPTRGGVTWDFRGERAMLVLTKDFSRAF